MKRRDYNVYAFEHIYQRTADRGILFYSDIDYIHFFTIICVYAVKYNIRIVSISLMPDHFHLLIYSPSPESTSSFMRDCTALYALEFNEYCRRKGRLWQKSYGKALKISDKSKRTAIAYVNNNGVEKQLCHMTEEHKWNFLAYYKNSKMGEVRHASRFLKKAKAIVRRYHEQNNPIGIYLLERMRNGLDNMEWNLLGDYIISLYNVIDYQSAIRLYGNYETMLIALNSNTGSEYEIKEDRNGLSDSYYNDIHKFLLKNGFLKDATQNPRQLMRHRVSDREQLAEIIRKAGIASVYQIRKYLHLPLSKMKTQAKAP